VEAAMRRAHGNQSESARLLGITPRSVYNKMQKYRSRMRIFEGKGPLREG